MRFDMKGQKHCLSTELYACVIILKLVSSFHLQVACAFVAARVVILLPQGFIPLYLLDTLKMDRVK